MLGARSASKIFGSSRIRFLKKYTLIEIRAPKRSNVFEPESKTSKNEHRNHPKKKHSKLEMAAAATETYLKI